MPLCVRVCVRVIMCVRERSGEWGGTGGIKGWREKEEGDTEDRGVGGGGVGGGGKEKEPGV